jgi:hypothetical protein
LACEPSLNVTAPEAQVSSIDSDVRNFVLRILAQVNDLLGGKLKQFGNIFQFQNLRLLHNIVSFLNVAYQNTKASPIGEASKPS